MVRLKRLYYAKAVYHVIFRGNNRQRIFKETQDKEEFLKTLVKYKERFGFKLYGFVLMDNHAHLVIETNHLANISKIMQAILLSYSLKFRKKYSYVGHVWQGRFKSKIIEGESYILECLDYIHNNPVRAEMAASPQDYPWSSYYLYHGTNNNAIEGILQPDKLGDTSTVTLCF